MQLASSPWCLELGSCPHNHLPPDVPRPYHFRRPAVLCPDLISLEARSQLCRWPLCHPGLSPPCWTVLFRRSPDPRALVPADLSTCLPLLPRSHPVCDAHGNLGTLQGLPLSGPSSHIPLCLTCLSLSAEPGSINMCSKSQTSQV